MAFKADEVAEIFVGGARYRDWETVTVKLEWEKSRACTHKSRLSGNRWLMSALPPKAAV
jgi:hypothetical protein